MDDVGRRVARPERDSLEVQRRLGDLRIGDRRIALLEELHLELGQLGHLTRALAEALGDVLPQVIGNGHVAALDLDAHRPTSLLEGWICGERPRLNPGVTFVDAVPTPVPTMRENPNL